MAGENEPVVIPAPEPGRNPGPRRDGASIGNGSIFGNNRKMDPLTMLIATVLSLFVGGGGFASFKELDRKLEVVMSQQTDNAKVLARVEAYMTTDSVTKAEMKAEIVRLDRENRELSKSFADHDARLKALERAQGK